MKSRPVTGFCAVRALKPVAKESGAKKQRPNNQKQIVKISHPLYGVFATVRVIARV